MLVGWGRRVHRDRLQAAAEAIWNGAPDAGRQRRPALRLGQQAHGRGRRFIAQGLSYVTDTEYELLGKPSDTAMLVAARRLGVAPATSWSPGTTCGWRSRWPAAPVAWGSW